MNLIVSIGKDTLATQDYLTKRACRQALTRAEKRAEASDTKTEWLPFMGRRYKFYELKEVTVYTPEEYFQALLKCTQDTCF